MSRIRGKDTTPEKTVRSLLHRLGYRFRLHRKIPIPDTTLRSREREKVAVGRMRVIGEKPISAERDRVRRQTSDLRPPTPVLRSREREKVAAGRMRVAGGKPISAERDRVRRPTPPSTDLWSSVPTSSSSNSASPSSSTAGGLPKSCHWSPRLRTCAFAQTGWHRHRGCKNCTTPTHRRSNNFKAQSPTPTGFFNTAVHDFSEQVHVPRSVALSNRYAAKCVLLGGLASDSQLVFSANTRRS